MPGDPPARLLDLTRLVSRVGRGPLTGIDRVELAYLRHMLDGPVPCFGLVRTALGFLLLDRAAMQRLRELSAGGRAPGQADLLSRMTWRNAARAGAEAELRRMAVARAPVALAGGMLRRAMPQGASYLNVGHANLVPGLMGTIRRALDGRIAVLVHDTIPLDHPQFARRGIPAAFARKMQAVARHADLAVFTTADARDKAAPHLARLGRMPEHLVAPLGIDLPPPDGSALPDGLDLSRPFFLVLGTIEPRKNHAFLLDLWEEMHATRDEGDIPRLVIAGSRGWANAEVFRRLDSLPFMGRTVFECHGLPDAAVAALLESACALVFPSHAEGFGLPAVESAALGCPVICMPLPVFRELLGDYPVYLPTSDRYAWLETMNTMVETFGQAGATARRRRDARIPPDWSAHFGKVFSVV